MSYIVKKKETKAFLKYRKDKNDEVWAKENSSVFEVTVSDSETKKVIKTFIINGYDIFKTTGEQFDYQNGDISELWNTIKATNLVSDYMK